MEVNAVPLRAAALSKADATEPCGQTDVLSAISMPNGVRVGTSHPKKALAILSCAASSIETGGHPDFDRPQSIDAGRVDV